MSDSKLHLMSFAPVPDTKTTVHVVGLPDSLRDALFTLMPPRRPAAVDPFATPFRFPGREPD